MEEFRVEYTEQENNYSYTGTWAVEILRLKQRKKLSNCLSSIALKTMLTQQSTSIECATAVK